MSTSRRPRASKSQQPAQSKEVVGTRFLLARPPMRGPGRWAWYVVWSLGAVSLVVLFLYLRNVGWRDIEALLKGDKFDDCNQVLIAFKLCDQALADQINGRLPFVLGALALVIIMGLRLNSERLIWSSENKRNLNSNWSRRTMPSKKEAFILREGTQRWQLRYHLEEGARLEGQTVINQLNHLADQINPRNSRMFYPITLEAVSHGGKLRFYIEGPKAHARVIESAVRSAIPGAELTAVDPAPLVRSLYTYMRYETSPPSGSLMRGFVAAQAQLQYRRSQAAKDEFNSQGGSLGAYLRDANSYRTYDARTTRLIGAGGSDIFSELLTDDAAFRISYFSTRTDSTGQAWMGLSVSLRCTDPDLPKVVASIMGIHVDFVKPRDLQWEDEIARVIYDMQPDFHSREGFERWVHLPATLVHPEVDRTPPFALPLPSTYSMHVENGKPAAIVLGTSGDTLAALSLPQGTERYQNDLFRHFLIKGAAGTGKSHLMIMMMMQAIHMGMSLVFVDPHAQTARKVWRRMTAAEKSRTEIIDLSRREDSIHLNLIDMRSGDLDMVSTVALSFFKLLGLSESTVTRYQFVSAWTPILLANAYNTNKHHEFGILQLVDAMADQEECLRIARDFSAAKEAGMTGRFKVFPQDLETALADGDLKPVDWRARVQGVRRSIATCYSDAVVRSLMDPPFFDPSKLLDGGGILLCNLPVGRGAAVPILVKLVLLSLQQSIMGREERYKRFGDDATHAYRPTLLMIDEARHVLGENSTDSSRLIADLLRDFRKYRCGVGLAFQDLDAVDRQVERGVMTNTQNKICFRETTEAGDMARIMAPPVDATWLSRLNVGEHQGLVRLLNNDGDLIATINTLADVPDVATNAAGVPLYTGTGQALVWDQDVPLSSTSAEHGVPHAPTESLPAAGGVEVVAEYAPAGWADYTGLPPEFESGQSVAYDTPSIRAKAEPNTANTAKGNHKNTWPYIS